MLILFVTTQCPYCHKVLEVAEEIGLILAVRDISKDREALGVLKERGGKLQVPFLLDDDKNVAMYESDDIITYLRSVA